MRIIFQELPRFQFTISRNIPQPQNLVFREKMEATFLKENHGMSAEQRLEASNRSLTTKPHSQVLIPPGTGMPGQLCQGFPTFSMRNFPLKSMEKKSWCPIPPLDVVTPPALPHCPQFCLPRIYARKRDSFPSHHSHYPRIPRTPRQAGAAGGRV